MKPIDLSNRFANCKRCFEDPATFRRDGATALLTPWCPPRGWGGTTRAGHRALMVVTINPGAPMKGELPLYRSWGISRGNKVTKRQSTRLLSHCTQLYTEPAPGPDTVFHRKIVTYVRAALWVLGERDRVESRNWINHVWFTDAFKCSTRSERAPSIPKRALEACRPHLEDELKAFTPSIVMAFGGKAREALSAMAQADDFPPLFALPFPVNAGLKAVTAVENDNLFESISRVGSIGWTTALQRSLGEFRQELLTTYFP